MFSAAALPRAAFSRCSKCATLSGQCRATDRRDFTDGDLTVGLIEEGLDVLEAAICRGSAA
jgi:hypothetical protein